MKKIAIITFIVFALILSGCNMPGYQDTMPEESDDVMATEISRILTGTPIPVEPSPTAQVAEEQEETSPPEVTEEPLIEPTNTPEPEEPTETPEPSHTPTITPTATLADTDPAATLDSPDWVDTMKDGDNWPVGYNEYTSIKFEDGFLKLTAETDLDGWRLSWPYLEDFYLEAKVQTPECAGADHFGLMFRVPEKSNANKGYLFGITCDGRYSLRRWDGETMYFPINWTKSDAIIPGKDAVNTLGVMAKGANLAFFINGQKVNEIADNAYLDGQFGIFVGGTNTDNITVWVDQIRYWIDP